MVGLIIAMINETSVLLMVAIVLCAVWLYRNAVRNFDYWKKRGIVFQKPVPIFGNIKDIATCKLTQAECLQNIYRTYADEKYVGMFQMGTPTLLVRDAALIKQFLVKDFQHFTDRGFVYDEQKEPLTAHLVNLEGVRWKVLRQKLTPTFSTKKIKNMIGLLQECSQQLTKYVQEMLLRDDEETPTKNIEMRELTARFTTDVIGSCAFGLQFNSMTDKSSEFREMGQKALRPSALMSVSKLIRVFFPGLFKLFRLRTFPKEVNHFFLSVVSETLRYRENNNIYREDFLQLLLQLRKLVAVENDNGDDREQIELTDSLIAAQAFVFFLAGFETSSTTLSFCLYELAVNESCQRKAIDQIQSAVDKHGDRLFSDYEALKELNYLEQCLLETMRKYPPVQALARVCTKPYTIPNTKVTIDEGTALLIPVFAIHHDEKYYPDPEKFDPNRFSKENINERENTYMPFGDGPRICIGMRFAMLEMKLALATFLYSYEIEKCAQTVVPLQLDPTSFILAPKNGIWLTVKKRHSS